MLNIAHRGASGRYPENTLLAFQGAIDAGANICELDVQASSDGSLVVIHDETVDRTTDGTGAVKSMTLEKLKRLDASAPFSPPFAIQHIPTLEEVFELAKNRCALNVELKAAGIERRVCDVIGACQAMETAIVSSFDWSALAIVRHLEPRVRIGLLASRWPARLLGAAFELRAEAIHPRADIVTEDLCIAAHERGLSVYTWVADEVTEMRRLIACGVDGIMTNYPDRLQELMERY